MSAENGAARAHAGAALLGQLLTTAEVVMPPQGGHPSGNATSNTLITSPGSAALDEAPVSVDPWPEPPQGPAYHGLAGQIVAAIEPHT